MRGLILRSLLIMLVAAVVFVPTGLFLLLILILPAPDPPTLQDQVDITILISFWLLSLGFFGGFFTHWFLTSLKRVRQAERAATDADAFQ